jgi:hypothetical protein
MRDWFRENAARLVLLTPVAAKCGEGGSPFALHLILLVSGDTGLTTELETAVAHRNPQG